MVNLTGKSYWCVSFLSGIVTLIGDEAIRKDAYQVRALGDWSAYMLFAETSLVFIYSNIWLGIFCVLFHDWVHHSRSHLHFNPLRHSFTKDRNIGLL